MIRLITSDLDETLLKTDKKVGKDTIQSISKVMEKEAYFVCATGRNYTSIQNTLKEIGTWNQEDTYTISLNGSVVTENKENKILFCEGMSYDLIHQLFQYALTWDVCIHVYTVDTVYCWNINDDEIEFLSGRMEVVPVEEKSIEFLKDTEIIKILFENTDFEYLQQIEKNLDPSILPFVEISYSSNRYLEFNKKGISKGTGLHFLCEYLQIPIEDTMAIGDNYNDVGMFKEAGLSVGVKNIHPDLMDQVDVILEYTHNEDAVGHALEQYVL